MIRILDQSTIDKIAAGEVIERPSSIVKELVENSIDAGATAVTVEIKDGGISMIRVTDNGAGIDKDEVRTAYMRHATSKLETAKDLQGVATLGFRGEALSTIAAVSQTEMVTKTRDSLTGVKYVIHGGKEVEFKEIGAPDGTTILVKNVFYNTPARLKFLKSNMTEGSYINDLITRLALSSPTISFRLISNGKTVVDTTGNGKVKDVIYSIYGRDITRNLLEVHSKIGDIEIEGYIGKPFISKGNRSFENYFINHRYIKSNIVNRAIEEGYKTFVMQHKFPFTALYLTLPGNLLDVNVHPTKMEFRYHDEKELFSAVHKTILDGLSEKELIPETSEPVPHRKPSVSPAHTEMKSSVSPAHTEMKSSDSPVHTNMKPTVSPAHPDMNPDIRMQDTNKPDISKSDIRKTDIRKPEQGERKPHSVKSQSAGSSYTILEALLPESLRREFREEAPYASNEDERKKIQNPDQTATDPEPESTDAGKQPPEPEVYEQKSIFLSEQAMKKHRIIGQVFDTYWLIEYGDELYIMDQHAAHEKVNYERFLKEFKNKKPVSQQIFPPEIISVTASEKLLIQENIELFQKAGFELEDFGGSEWKLIAIPVDLYGLKGREIFQELTAGLSDGVSDVTEDIFVRKLSTMACKAAIKGGQAVSEREIEYLLEQLLTLDNPYTCPHGRPTIIRMSKTDLEKKFKRIV